jgi:hypothetical protein
MSNDVKDTLHNHPTSMDAQKISGFSKKLTNLIKKDNKRKTHKSEGQKIDVVCDNQSFKMNKHGEIHFVYENGKAEMVFSDKKMGEFYEKYKKTHPTQQ